MATFLKFKLLATHCGGVAQNPTLSPRTSPLVVIRRRKTTLRMLLNRNSGRWPSRRRDSSEEEKKKTKDVKDSKQRSALKDLFVSSPPFEEIKEKRATVKSLVCDSVHDPVEPDGSPRLSMVPGSPRPVWSGFRYRFLLRRAWRPMLVTIPE